MLGIMKAFVTEISYSYGKIYKACLFYKLMTENVIWFEDNFLLI